MSLRQTIELALKDKEPKLHAELKAAGKLQAHLQELEDQVAQQTVDAVQTQRLAEKWDNLGSMESAGRMRTAASLAREAALAEVLQFPQDETSSPS